MALTLNRSIRYPIMCPLSIRRISRKCQVFQQQPLLHFVATACLDAFVTLRADKLLGQVIDRSSPSGHFWVKKSENLILTSKKHEWGRKSATNHIWTKQLLDNIFSLCKVVGVNQTRRWSLLFEWPSIFSCRFKFCPLEPHNGKDRCKTEVSV